MPLIFALLPIANWMPEGKDILCLIGGTILGYILSTLQGRRDRFKATMESAVKALDFTIEKLPESKGGVDAYFNVAATFKNTLFELTIQRQQNAQLTIAVLNLEMEKALRDAQTKAHNTPSDDPFLDFCGGDREMHGAQIAAVAMRRQRDRWALTLLNIQPELTGMFRLPQLTDGQRRSDCGDCCKNCKPVL